MVGPFGNVRTSTVLGVNTAKFGTHTMVVTRSKTWYLILIEIGPEGSNRNLLREFSWEEISVIYMYLEEQGKTAV